MHDRIRHKAGLALLVAFTQLASARRGHAQPALPAEAAQPAPKAAPLPSASAGAGLGAGARTASAPAPASPSSPSSWETDGRLLGLMAEPFLGSKRLGDWGYGLALGFGAGLRRFPITFGGELALAKWPSLTKSYEVDLGPTRAQLDETRSDLTVFFNGVLRLQFPSGRVRPFLEGVAGLKLLNSEYSLGFTDGEGSNSTSRNTGTAWTYGLGGGVDVLLARASDGSPSAVFATLGLRWLRGTPASTDTPPGQEYAGVPLEIPTHTILLTLGFSVRMGRSVLPARRTQ